MTGELAPASKSAAQARLRQDRRAVLVVNTHSRRGARHVDHARALLEARGLTITAVHAVTDPPAQLPTLLAAIMADPPPLLVVGSGDGTIATVVDHVAYSGTVLGYLPLGTTNNFGRSIGLPFDLAGAVDVITGGKVAHVDLGRANGDLFANLVSVGISAAVAQHTPSRLKRRLGRGGYALTALRALATHRPFTARVQAGDATWRVRTHQLNIANGRSHGGTPIAADAHIDDGELVAYPLGGSSRLSTVRAAAAQALTPHQPLEQKRYLTAPEFVVATDPPLPVDVDGEITTRTPVHVQVAREALLVLVPNTFRDRD